MKAPIPYGTHPLKPTAPRIEVSEPAPPRPLWRDPAFLQLWALLTLLVWVLR